MNYFGWYFAQPEPSLANQSRFSAHERTTVRYNLPVKIVVLNNGGIGPGMPEIPENPIFNMKPNTRIWAPGMTAWWMPPVLRRGRLRPQGLL